MLSIIACLSCPTAARVIQTLHESKQILYINKLIKKFPVTNTVIAVDIACANLLNLSPAIDLIWKLLY